MKIIDLTHPVIHWNLQREDKRLKSPGTEYTGVVYRLSLDSADTSYLDLPGHIRETDDGRHAANTGLSEFYRKRATLLRPEHRPDGAVTRELLERAASGKTLHPVMILHALGETDDADIPLRNIYLTSDAVEWFAEKRCRCIIGDAWESVRLDGVFLRLFRAGISCVCHVVNLRELPENKEFFVSVVFLPYPGVTQIPCRVFAEVE